MPIEEERAKIERFNTKVLPELVKELTAADVETWSIEPPTQADIDNGVNWRSPTIISSAGERLFIRVEGYQHQNKITVSGSYGQLPDGNNWYVSAYMRGEHSDPSATMTLTKTPKQLAADITRRVLQGGYRFYRAEYLKRCQEQTDSINATAANARRIEQASNGMFYIRPSYHGMNDIRKGSVTMDTHGVRVGIKVSSSYVEIDWSGPVDKAERIIRLLVEMGEAEEEE